MATREYPDVAETFDDIIRQLERGMSASQINVRSRDAIKYFQTKNRAKAVDTGRPGIELLTKGQRGVSDFIPGTIMTYLYDAKHADTLEFWDRAPLIIFLDVQKNGNFLGLNLHYLPPNVRAKILALLMKTVTATKLRHDVRMKLTYSMCQQIAAYQPLQFCLKSYIPNRITSKIVRIQPQDWTHAIFFPSDRFQKKSNRYVWAQSKKFR
ncbi:DNA end protector protein during packaging [Rhizobium phage RHph_I46]|uniref:DNA end protector protein during packaging n=1 Tax=Rhizobium phage RHph_I1_9 TaxID=2509729 RepID=A0A7S5R9K0_9CAUD|nr:DNA end protector protein during packaging [Rhizobium phage RHph_I1_9]QIG69655.1 DNA end protector protein during packaging [Rhizobium phage RHph_I46]QIG70936.1 DNA end protector protein during packaging [Rhizobium phage RHph_I9]QIG73522.1 DNA end protector protein during packaging [Rhizobium phage RHph_I1_9]QIG76275.1 DNA end protector protein during packaging [Rhizobium phage RHph_I34]